MRNKFINIVSVVGMLLVLMAITTSCEDYDYPTPSKATVATLPAESVTGSSAVFTGIIISENGHPVSTKGFCWSTEPNPTQSNNFVEVKDTDADTISYKIDTLKVGTVYYYRAYATNNGGIAFGENVRFETFVVPDLKTLDVTDITETTAISGGEILDSRGKTVVERGICWSTEENPTKNDNYAVDNSGSDSYKLEMKGLVKGTTYHVRAYVITDEGSKEGFETYGEDVRFATPIVKDYDGNYYTAVTIGDQTWMVENYKCTTYANGNPIDAKWNKFDTEHEYGLTYKQVDILKEGFAPKGWHVPSKEEVEKLVATVGRKNMLTLKEPGTAHWKTDNGTNETGFTALGAFVQWGALKDIASWWTSTKRENNPKGWRWLIKDNGDYFGGELNTSVTPFPVRLIKDK